MTDWSGASPAASRSLSNRGRAARGPVAAIPGLLVAAALLSIVSGVVQAVTTAPGLDFQGRLTLAASGANAVTGLLVIAAMLVARRARGLGGAAIGGVVASAAVVVAGCYELVVAFTDRPVLSGYYGYFGFAPNSSPNLPSTFHVSAATNAAALLLLGVAAVWLSARAFAD